MTWKTVRDYKNFNEENFVRLLTMIDWNQFDVSLDPNVQWLFMKEEILNVLSVMCPYKRVYTRKKNYVVDYSRNIQANQGKKAPTGAIQSHWL